MSDWCSDVCSSDLLKRRNAEPGCVGQPLARPPEARQLFAHRGGDLFARAAIQISLHRRDSYHNRAMLPHISAQMFTGAAKSIRARPVADEHSSSLSWREGCLWPKMQATSRDPPMTRHAQLNPPPPLP